MFLEIHSKEGIIFLVQVDHLSGEWIGQAIEAFYQAGASNVQVVSSITKKNRPAYMVYIDCRLEFCDAVEALIPVELGTGGWHRIETDHRYLHSRIVRRALTLCHGDGHFGFTVQGKVFEGGHLRPEHDNVVDLKEKISNNFFLQKSYGDVYQIVLTALHSPEDSELLITI